MSKIRFVGLDVHADTIGVAVAEPDGEVALSASSPTVRSQFANWFTSLLLRISFVLATKPVQQDMFCIGS
jgi:hypothetical protein